MSDPYSDSTPVPGRIYAMRLSSDAVLKESESVVQCPRTPGALRPTLYIPATYNVGRSAPATVPTEGSHPGPSVPRPTARTVMFHSTSGPFASVFIITSFHNRSYDHPEVLNKMQLTKAQLAELLLVVNGQSHLHTRRSIVIPELAKEGHRGSYLIIEPIRVAVQKKVYRQWKNMPIDTALTEKEYILQVKAAVERDMFLGRRPTDELCHEQVALHMRHRSDRTEGEDSLPGNHKPSAKRKVPPSYIAKQGTGSAEEGASESNHSTGDGTQRCAAEDIPWDEDNSWMRDEEGVEEEVALAPVPQVDLFEEWAEEELGGPWPAHSIPAGLEGLAAF
ncbi:hypothetical protein HDU88_008139 [Geranomyces variabilis]|nr:hypothetical protein HDU88_008139 [Geranomyces variabilis]